MIKTYTELSRISDYYDLLNLMLVKMMIMTIGMNKGENI